MIWGADPSIPHFITGVDECSVMPLQSAGYLDAWLLLLHGVKMMWLNTVASKFISSLVSELVTCSDRFKRPSLSPLVWLCCVTQSRSFIATAKHTAFPVSFSKSSR